MVSRGLAGAAMADPSDEEREHRRRRIWLWRHPRTARPVDSFFFVLGVIRASLFWHCSSPFRFFLLLASVFSVETEKPNRETDTEFVGFFLLYRKPIGC
jgi:hypothetical protein